MLYSFDLKLDKLVSAYWLILLNYIFIVVSMIQVSKYSYVGLFFYFPSYLLATWFNHLAYFAKIENYPNDEIKNIMPRNKWVWYFVYTVLFVPVVFPEWIVIRSIAFVLYMLECKCIIVVNIVRLMYILSFIGWLIIVDNILDGFIICLTMILFMTLWYYRYYVIRKIWYIIGIFLPATFLCTFGWISAVWRKIQ